MDCRMENAAFTFVRIEALALQGICRSIVLSLLLLLAIPFVPFVIVVSQWMLAKGEMPWWWRVLMVPFWLAKGIMFALVSPWVYFGSVMVDTRDICRYEWANRWRSGVPKNPKGHPLEILPPETKAMEDANITLGVMADYGAPLNIDEI